MRTDAANQKQKDDVLILSNVLTMIAYATRPESFLSIAPLSISASPICSPICDQKLMDTRESWRQC
ncbi:hypothetical protein HX776_05595 [Pseudomonas agarici]|uniref:hypothetical protein n=1 Tax=Pseudomonas agarici TaxID=46677 RepID=UPI0003751521|nr:hypothetical protein [Pseudomonas agarici]NWC08300.1 hypothetical protein [Pseudomonas agarici]